MKILMVCLGNICRSPLAEEILRTKATEKGLNWEIDSAGTGAWHIGHSPDGRAQAVAKQHGIDISHQKARQLNVKDFETFDLILAMDDSNYSDIISLAQKDEQRQKVRKILKTQSVPDPYYNDNGFEAVYQLLSKACEQLMAEQL